jgi:hopene-associated glycosyltransferase HpnB
MPSFLVAVAALSPLIWLYLAIFHGRYWRADQRLAAEPQDRGKWPAVVAVIPARNEAAVIGTAIYSLLAQDYPGPLKVVMVDDRSTDGTARIARDAAAGLRRANAFTIVTGERLAAGWSGKTWALHQGVRAAKQIDSGATYLLLTDADIEHDQRALRRLVAKAEDERCDLVSLMVRLHCEDVIERLLIPAFVYFFQQLYPFPESNKPGSEVAAAAGGCMLVRRNALERAGGMESIRGELIDDCALARRIKATGPIWIGLAEYTRSIRPYNGVGDVWDMVARTAYTQLGHSRFRLFWTVIGLALTYLAPPVVLVAGLAGGDGQVAALGALAWMIMVMTYAPTLRLYRQPVVLGLALPVVAALYTLMTIDSARRHWQGRGGAWKGRTYSGLERP